MYEQKLALKYFVLGVIVTSIVFRIVMAYTEPSERVDINDIRYVLERCEELAP